MNSNYRPTIDEALESVEKLDSIVDMLDYGGALSTDGSRRSVHGIDYYQAVHSKLCSVCRINLKENNYGKQGLYC